jgi:DNA-binding response OmpR family regulator
MPSPDPQTAAPLRVLIAEDVAIVGFSVAEDLGEFGYRTVGPFVSGLDALRWLETETADLAVLDPMLKDGLCTGLADALTRRGVPFLVFSGGMRDRSTPEAFENAVWIEKPASIEHLVEALEGLRKSTA